jgi:PTS system mannose-specific IID component
MAAPSVSAFVRATLRLLTVQACWNYERMIGVGLAYTSEPLLRSLPGGRTGEPYRDAMRRATRYFNAHPYLAGLAAGALARAEQEQADRLRTALLGPLGAIGDRLVWAGTLPAASAVGLALSADTRAGIGAAALLALYNVPHLTLRIWGLRAGWRYGLRLGRALGTPVLTTALKVIGPVAAWAIGVALPVAARRLAGELDVAGWTATALAGIVGVVVMHWVAPRLGAVRLGLLAALAVIVGTAW